jgi:hypothetical protein
MNIRELISAVDRYQDLSEAKPKVKQDASGNWVNAETGDPVQPEADNTVEFPKQAGAQQTAEPAASGPTGDPTLDQAPEGPGVMSKAKDWVKSKGGLGKVIGKGVGQLAKGVGAVAGGVAGAGRAMSKGFKAGADTVGGPGRAPSSSQNRAGTPASGAASRPAAIGTNVDSEITDLRNLINRLDARMTAAGIRETKKK